MSCNKFDEYRLGDLVGISSSKRIYAKEYLDYGIPFYRSKEIIEKHKGNEISTELYISEERYNELRERFGVPNEGDILLTSVGTLGVPYLVRDEEFYFKDGNLTWFKCFNNKCNNEFIYYWLQSPFAKEQIYNKSIGSTQKALTIDTLRKFKISLPNLDEQKKIVSILSSLDKKIELNNEMNKTLEEIAQALFKRWFVDFEFPNEEGKPYKSSGGEMVESELGMIPEGWSYGIFSDISKRIYSGGTPNTKEESYWNGLLPWMSSGETRNSFVTNTEKSITELGVVKSSTKLANKYNTVIASAGQGFTRGQTSLLLIDTYVNQSLIVIDGCEEFELFNYINIKLRYNELRAISDSHSIRGSLTTKMMAALGTIIPSIEILKKYNSIIKPIIDIIENNISNTNRLIELRDSLLPKLMSGEIRVDNLETDI